MKTANGNIWDFHKLRHIGHVVIPTNGFVKTTGECVMGRGLAAQCAKKFPRLPKYLGNRLTKSGNHVYLFALELIITFPVKHVWWERANPELILQSVIELITLVNDEGIQDVYIPQVGCGNGGLNWSTVRPLLAPLDDRFTVVSL